MIFELLKELKLLKKLFSITGDNASNNKSLVSELEILIRDVIPAPRFCDESSFVNCMAPFMNLVAKSILKLLNPKSFANTEIACVTANDKITPEIRAISVVARVRLLAIYLKSSLQRKQAWETLCKEHNLPQTVLQYDVGTRWNSTYKMLQSSIKLKEQIKLYPGETKILPAFIYHDWHRIEQVCSVLRWLDSATETVSRNGSGEFLHTSPLLLSTRPITSSGGEN
ncbi:ribonuclease H-like domain-containing protein [Lipomyces japonicus]|uniref:ribonuclease H-like domain-containing protein n=1 Tax=Lipomyces japonicus TaxID=56871 RepID=UPI0034CFEF83